MPPNRKTPPKRGLVVSDLGAAARRGLGRHRLDPDAGGAVHRQLARGGAGEVDHPTPERPSVVDRDQDCLAVVEIGDSGVGAEGQVPMRGGERVLVEAFATRGLFPVEARSVPGGLAHLGAARVCGEGDGGKGDDGRHDQGRNGGENRAGPAGYRALRTFVHERTSSVGSWRFPNRGRWHGIVPNWENVIGGAYHAFLGGCPAKYRGNRILFL